MAHLKRDIAEIARAIVVLALVFLNFAHAPLALAGDGTGAPVFCGDAPEGAPGEAKAKSPCAACRLGEGAVRPDAPCAADVVVLATQHVVYGTLAGPAIHAHRHVIAVARGPPAV